jgi:Ni2+-binding GTPase involved in maturation of urease and hydrogenase
MNDKTSDKTIDKLHDKVPVTVLTGYLGAGKTTLLNRILSEPHGQKFAVIVNEFGEIGIDNDLIVGADEEIFEMNNGCVCCTVRGDLIRIIEGLMRRKGKFDAIIVETTGLADPAPVAQTFFVDDTIGRKAKLDAVVTVADARWLKDRLRDAPEAKNQIAFADVILLNKTDLVSEADLREIEARIRGINPYARLHRTERCATSSRNSSNAAATTIMGMTTTTGTATATIMVITIMTMAASRTITTRTCSPCRSRPTRRSIPTSSFPGSRTWSPRRVAKSCARRVSSPSRTIPSGSCSRAST